MKSLNGMLRIFLLLVTIFVVFGCTLNDPGIARIKLDFSDTQNRRSNFKFRYVIRNENGEQLDGNELKLSVLGAAKIHLPKDAYSVGVYIEEENNIINIFGGGAFVYGDTGVLIISESDLVFYIVDPTDFSLDVSDDGINILIQHQKSADYYFVGIFDTDNQKVAEFIVNSKNTDIQLSKLIQAPFHIPETNFETDFAFAVTHQDFEFRQGHTYYVKVKSGIVNRYGSLRFYNQYSDYGVELPL